ncbi:MAG TPA: hypothetical protein PKW36_15130, partial [bacterium]|nr:hypothetical protein [bacterium]
MRIFERNHALPATLRTLVGYPNFGAGVNRTPVGDIIKYFKHSLFCHQNGCPRFLYGYIFIDDMYSI